MARRPTPTARRHDVTSIRYGATRKNIPPAGLASHGRVRDEAPHHHSYNPHLPPVLRSAPDPADGDRLPELLAAARERALSDEEAQVLAEALRRHEPWLEWSGKRERPWFEVDPVALHMHERVSTQAILRVLGRKDVNRDLFSDPELEYAQAVQFYRHDVEWANRLILGDSLQVMASLARREDLAGKVQMIYLDPPYGIRFSSNFQPELGRRDVKDRAQDLTREPEMVKAYRDTWTLGVHSYLAYLRDRLAMARELLADTGSLFVQINDEHLHHVRELMDEVFGPKNFVTQIYFSTTGGFASSSLLGRVGDYLLWYARDRASVKYRPLYQDKPGLETGDDAYKNVELADGARRTMRPEERSGHEPLPEGTRIFRLGDLQSTGAASRDTPFEFEAEIFRPNPNNHWKATWPDGLHRLRAAGRIERVGKTLSYVRYAADSPVVPLTNAWMDTSFAGFATDKQYVVETNPKVVQRCLLMTTDPGDLVLDPTCGSGTTAFVAEQWGRRWIAIDTSRVALTLAKHRLMTACFDYYRLRELDAEDVHRNSRGPWIAEVDAEGRPGPKPMTFRCRTVPRITLRDIARNDSLDPIFARHDPILAARLADLNREVAGVDAELKAAQIDKLVRKHRVEGARAVTDADIRRWLLPGADPDHVIPMPARSPLKALTARQSETYRARIPGTAWREWEVPFDADPDWPRPLHDALGFYRAAWRARRDEIDTCIAAGAASEELVDQPESVTGTVRVAGPFTVEGVVALEEGPDSPVGGAPDELPMFDVADGGIAATNAEAHLDKVIRLLRASGVDFAGNRNMRFEHLEPTVGAALIHAEGEWKNGAGEGRRVAVSIGPEVGNIASTQVEDAIRGANRAGYDDVVFAGFGFDAAAQEAIEDASHPRMRLHMALIRPDVAMDDLLKTQPGSQMFSVFSAPRVTGPVVRGGGEYTLAVEGMDVYDPVRGTLHPTDGERIAAWFLDTDYDGRTFCICQAFFPDRSKWDRLARALRGVGVVEPDAFQALSGLSSLPFSRPPRLLPSDAWRIAVKVIDPRGNEGLRVLSVDGPAA